MKSTVYNVDWEKYHQCAKKHEASFTIDIKCRPWLFPRMLRFTFRWAVICNIESTGYISRCLYKTANTSSTRIILQEIISWIINPREVNKPTCHQSQIDEVLSWVNYCSTNDACTFDGMQVTMYRNNQVSIGTPSDIIRRQARSSWSRVILAIGAVSTRTVPGARMGLRGWSKYGFYSKRIITALACDGKTWQMTNPNSTKVLSNKVVSEIKLGPPVTTPCLAREACPRRRDILQVVLAGWLFFNSLIYKLRKSFVWCSRLTAKKNTMLKEAACVSSKSETQSCTDWCMTMCWWWPFEISVLGIPV